ncbi:MAG: phosphoribosylanthranilate isomerase [Gammaproteobacteria bacterium]|nr:phosphoribosylanthranilate isomerase [Gammaproteobacteria bacterium]
MKKSRPRIKICGLTSAQLAYDSAKAGVNYIGLIFHPTSTRYVELSQASEISAATHEAGSQAVGVFVNHRSEQIIEICERSGIGIAQLHGDIARQTAQQLPSTLQRIYVRHIDATGSIINDSHFHDKNFDRHRDIILFDNIVGGSGQALNFTVLAQTPNLGKFFLAGGLTSENILPAITQCQPYGIDLSSGVETAAGKKSFTHIKKIIQLIHQNGDPL